MIFITNILKVQVLRFLALKTKAFLVFHVCIGRPISVVPEVTTETVVSVDDFFLFVSCYLYISSDTILYLLIHCSRLMCCECRHCFGDHSC
jgi:hypothetical protein